MTTKADKRKLDICTLKTSVTKDQVKRKKHANTADKKNQTYYLKINFLKRAASIKKFIKRRYWGGYSLSYKSTPRKCLYCPRICTFGKYMEHEDDCPVRIVSDSLSNSKRILDFCLETQDIYYDEEMYCGASKTELYEFIQCLTIDELNNMYCNWLRKQTDKKFTEIYDNSYFFEDLKAKKFSEIFDNSYFFEDLKAKTKPLSNCSREVELEPSSESSDSESNDSESSDSEEEIKKPKDCKRWIHPCRKNDTELGCGSELCGVCKYINISSAVKDWLKVHPKDAWVQNLIINPKSKYKPWIHPCRKSIEELGCGYKVCTRCQYKSLSHAMKDWFEVHPEDFWDRERFRNYYGIEVTELTIYSKISGICRPVDSRDVFVFLTDF